MRLRLTDAAMRRVLSYLEGEFGILEEFNKDIAAAKERGYNIKEMNLSPDSLIPKEGRKDSVIIEDFADQIRKVGGWPEELPPVLVEEVEGNLIIMDGHHRVLAAIDAGLQAIPVMLLPEDLVHDWQSGYKGDPFWHSFLDILQ